MYELMEVYQVTNGFAVKSIFSFIGWEGLGVIMSFFLGILYFCTIREMRRARKETYLPRLVIQPAVYDIKKRVITGGFDDSTFNLFDWYRYKKGVHKFNELIYLEIENLGLGAALDIEITWNFYNRRKVIDDFKNRNPDYFSTVEEIPSLNSDNDSNSSAATIEERLFSKNEEIRIAGLNQRIMMIDIPSDIKRYYQEIFDQECSSDNNSEIEFLSFRLEVNYYDISHQKYYMEYDICTEFFCEEGAILVSTEGVEDNPYCVSGSIYAKLIKPPRRVRGANGK